MSNLYKSAYVVQKESSNRVIDSNEMVAQKIQKLTEMMEARTEQVYDEEYDGFIEGLDAEQVESLLEDPDSAEENAGPSIDEQIQSAKDELEQLRLQADAVIEDAKKTAKDIMAQAEKDAARVLDEARQNGHDEGYNEGYSEGIRKAKETEDKLIEQDNRRQRDYESSLNEIEPMLVNKICDIYEHVIGVDLTGRTDIVMHLLSRAIRSIEGTNYLVHVSSDDFAYAGEHKDELTVSLGSINTLELIEDITLAQGQAFIETETGIYDCSLGVELDLLKKELKLLSSEDN